MINRYTELDVYPTPKIDELINSLAKYAVFSTLDLKSAYHQVPLRVEQKVHYHLSEWMFSSVLQDFILGEQMGQLPFQKFMKRMVRERNLHSAFAHIDNCMIHTGRT